MRITDMPVLDRRSECCLSVARNVMTITATTTWPAPGAGAPGPRPSPRSLPGRRSRRRRGCGHRDVLGTPEDELGARGDAWRCGATGWSRRTRPPLPACRTLPRAPPGRRRSRVRRSGTGRRGRLGALDLDLGAPRGVGLEVPTSASSSVLGFRPGHDAHRDLRAASGISTFEDPAMLGHVEADRVDRRVGPEPRRRPGPCR